MVPIFLIQIIVALVIVGLVHWVLAQNPMDAAIARIIRVVVIAFVVIWLLYVVLGMAGSDPPLLCPHR